MPEGNLNPGPESGAPELLAPGSVFAGRYRVLERIGSGGSSTVLRVEDQLAGQVIAIKILRRGLANDPSTIGQFRREVAIARQLVHPHVVRIFDIGEHEGLLYIVMEYVDGRPLSQMLAERGRFSLPELLPIASQFADALTYVHSNGVLHRDIKPNNLLVDRHGLLKLMDFGIARVYHGAGSMGTIVGTPAYMAPEQMAGEPVSQATDVFAAGAMIYELLTGKRPFRGLGVVNRMKEQPPPAHTLAPDLAPGVSDVLQRCLQFRPSDRYQSINQFMADLREYAPRSLVRPTREITLPEIDVPAERDQPRSGRTLADLIATDAPELATALRLLRRVFSAVAEVHAGGGHVRDSSPERIGIADDGTVELDWVRDDESMSGTTIAASDPQYSAPESFADSGLQTPNARQLRDIYVLGMVATEMLLGRREFGRQFHGVVAEAAVGWMRWHLDPSSVAPSLTAGGADIPAGLSQAVAGMLAKDPARRPQSLAPVIAEMDRVVDRLDQTVPQTMQTREVVMPAPLPEPASRFPRWAAALLALAPLAGLAGAAWWFYPSLRALIPRAAEPVARAPEKEPENQVSTSAEKKDEGKPEATPQLGQDQQRGEPMTVDPRFPKSLFFPSGDMMLIAPAAEGPGEPYYLDRYEVTNAAYRAFCQETKHKFPAPPDWDRDYANKDSHPVLNVSWNDAAAFAAWAGKRIPTEQEWEHAARGPDRMQFPWGNTMNETGANLAGPDEHPFAAPAGSMFYDLSPFGVADMLGNASEWVSGDAPAGFHVMKGSNFTVAPADAGLTRRVPVPDAGGGFVPVGFRCAMDAAKAVPEKAPAGAEAKK